MAITKKIRFEVFKRDGFQCAYCGKTPPEVTLEIDHVEPVSMGGTDDINNLLTACFGCNRGKSNIVLDKIPNKLADNLEILKEKQKQYKAYRKYIEQIRMQKDIDIELVEGIFKSAFPASYFTEAEKRGTVSMFLNYMSPDDVANAMAIACNKVRHPYYAFKYFCGICWKKVREAKNGNI